MPSFFVEMPIRSFRLWSRLVRVYAPSGGLRIQGVERSEQKEWTQQIIDFLQKADDGLGLRNEAIDYFEVGDGRHSSLDKSATGTSGLEPFMRTAAAGMPF